VEAAGGQHRPPDPEQPGDPQFPDPGDGRPAPGALDAWRDDPEVAAGVIDGAGEKAFCAGGDVQALHASAVGTPGGPCEYAESFFAREYRMNYTLHTYPKPILCWGHGIVMGGGWVSWPAAPSAWSPRATRMAMPEITIALFPDVGGSWFLNHMPGPAVAFWR
jgi:enoyl-CoA hydratase/carnithine racemase